MTKQEIEAQVLKARRERDAAIASRDSAAYNEADAHRIAMERCLSEVEGTEHAVRWVTAAWQPSYPEPLIYFDPFTVWVICPKPPVNRQSPRCSTIKFDHVLGHRYTKISDIMEEQPLYARGLESCAALEIMNSQWISILRKTYDGPQYWSDVRHFALCFKDCLVEVVAKSAEWPSAELELTQWIAIALKASSRQTGM